MNHYYQINYTDGTAPQIFDTAEEAIEFLREDFPELVAENFPECVADIETDRYLVWENEAESENDAGQRAIASITEEVAE